MSDTEKTTAEETDATAVESFGDNNDYQLADDDTFSVHPTVEGVAVYGKQKDAPWNLSWSGAIVTSRIFKVRAC